MMHLVQMIPIGYSPLYRATILYTVLAKYVAYDYTACEKFKRDPVGLEYQSATYAGAVFNGMAVCSGIAQLFAVLCRRSGIPSRVVEGYAGFEEDQSLHAWVQIDLLDRYDRPVSYHCDPTWDLSEADGIVQYRYFLKSDEYFREHYHAWYHSIGADLGWEKFRPCPEDCKWIPAAPESIVYQMGAYFRSLRLPRPYILKKEERGE